MINSPLPAHVDATKIFTHQAQLEGSIAVAKLSKVKPLLADDSGEVLVSLHFGFNKEGRRHISGNLQASIKLECQRCLEPIEAQLHDDIDLVVVDDEEQAQQLDKNLDLWICDRTKIDLISLVDEQLALSLPIVSYHEDSACMERLGYSASKAAEKAKNSKADEKENKIRSDNGKANPFAVLESLKQDK